jgi:hypothetical protein
MTPDCVADFTTIQLADTGPIACAGTACAAARGRPC